MRSVVIALAAVTSLVLLFGCARKPYYKPQPPVAPSAPDYNRQLPPGRLALRKITDPAEIPDFTMACSDVAGLREAIAHSLDYLAHPSSQGFYPYAEITHEQVIASLKEFSTLLDSGKSPEDMNKAIRRNFDVYTSVGWDDNGTVLFTGYYTPIFDGSPARTDKFRYPIYRLPPDLVKSPEGDTLGLMGADGAIAPCPPRREIEEQQLFKGQELFWLAEPFEVYVAQLQGSARLRLPDGRMVTVGYAANNGHEYRSVAEELIKDGKMRREELSMQKVMSYFRANPGDVNEYVWRNPRFVFFTESGDAPRGSINQPVTPMRTIATDKAIYPRAALAFMATSLPTRSGGTIVAGAYRGFALDQDAGGAIRAAGRCDVYMGIGDAAGELAGRVMSEGRLYYIFVKPGPAPE